MTHEHDERHIIRLKKVEPSSEMVSTPMPAPAEPTPTPPVKKTRNVNLRYAIVFIGIAVLLTGGKYAYDRFYVGSAAHTETLAEVVPETPQARDESVVAKVGALMLLPGDEVPTIAVVSDLKPLKEQVFFKNAQLDDVVLIYTSAAKAILYRPSENKVIEVAAITQ